MTAFTDECAVARQKGQSNLKLFVRVAFREEGATLGFPPMAGSDHQVISTHQHQRIICFMGQAAEGGSLASEDRA